MLPTLLKKLVETALLPPGCLILLGLAGLVLLRRRPRLARGLLGLGLGLTWVLCTPVVGSLLLASLQPAGPLVLDEGRTDARAIVVLGGDLDPAAPEYGGPSVGELTLERLRYAARLQRETGLPILATGGDLGRSEIPLGELMRAVLEDDFRAEVRWTETRSQTTAENAARCAELLAEFDVRHVILVTHAWHVPRAARAFERAGLLVTPGPTAFVPGPNLRLADFRPSTGALENSTWALHELVGRLWYALRSAGERR